MWVPMHAELPSPKLPSDAHHPHSYIWVPTGRSGGAETGLSLAKNDVRQLCENSFSQSILVATVMVENMFVYVQRCMCMCVYKCTWIYICVWLFIQVYLVFFNVCVSHVSVKMLMGFKK